MEYLSEPKLPELIEPGVKYFLDQALKQSHIVREQFNYIMINVGLFVLLFLFLGMFLLYKYKGKLTPHEMAIKNKEKHQYILEKIQQFQINKQKAHQELITGLPNWENEYDIINSRPEF